MIENKPCYNIRDKIKLDNLFSSPARMNYFVEALSGHCIDMGMQLSINLLCVWKALGFSGRALELPEDYIFFIVDNNKIDYFAGKNIPEVVKTSLR